MSESKPKYVTIMLVPDGTEARAAWRIRRWVLNTLVWGVVTILVGIVLFFIFYGHILHRAALTDQLIDENKALLRYQYKVQLLEQNLMETREIVSRMATMAGIDVEFPEIPDDSTLFAQLENPRGAVVERKAGQDLSYPSGLPIQGFISQDFVGDEGDHYHPGIDIVASVGTPVLATAAGEVVLTGVDSTYGNILVIKHNDSVTTLYGHNDSLLVREGQQIMAGSRIALSGNTGISTAPHLHYEIRIHDKPINPLEKPYDE